VIASWLGVPSFDRYIVMRIDTTKDLINAIGGVDVNVENSDALRGTGRTDRSTTSTPGAICTST